MISISLGDNRVGRSLGRAVDLAYEAGTIVTCAAGNYYGPLVFPAVYDRTICVAGVTRKGIPWCGSCRGRRVDISAPADEVPRPNSYLHEGEVVTDAYGEGDGTSYATVHVAAAAALWLAYRRRDIDATYGRDAGVWRRVEAFRELLKRTARPFRTLGVDEYGAGILDMHALLRADLPEAAELTKSPRAEPQRWL